MSEKMETKPWLNFRNGRWEVNPSFTETAGVVINIGTDFNVEVDKLYGLLAAETVRVRLESKTTEWVVERYRIDTDVWEEKARWYCQESWPTDREEA